MDTDKAADNTNTLPELVSCDDERMLVPSVIVELPGSEDYISKLEVAVERMKTVCKLKNGISLSAKQIGENYRMFIMRESITSEFIVCINPSILRHGKEQTVVKEGCLSSPGRTELKIRRVIIDVSYISATGLVVKETLKRSKAVIFQHEMDHLDGFAFHDKDKVVQENAV